VCFFVQESNETQVVETTNVSTTTSTLENFVKELSPQVKTSTNGNLNQLTELQGTI